VRSQTGKVRYPVQVEQINLVFLKKTLALVSHFVYISNTSYFPTTQGPSLQHLGEAETSGFIPGASIL
jgi:hypothetical protein